MAEPVRPAALPLWIWLPPLPCGAAMLGLAVWGEAGGGPPALVLGLLHAAALLLPAGLAAGAALERGHTRGTAVGMGLATLAATVVVFVIAVLIAFSVACGGEDGGESCLG